MKIKTEEQYKAYKKLYQATRREMIGDEVATAVAVSRILEDIIKEYEVDIALRESKPE